MLILAVFVCLFALPRGREVKGSNAEKRVIRVWNVDTFEGGKGSRTAFLKKTALRAENVNAGAYYLVSSYTPEGAQQAFREGDFPDVLSESACRSAQSLAFLCRTPFRAGKRKRAVLPSLGAGEVTRFSLSTTILPRRATS